MADLIWVTLLGHLVLPIGIVAWIGGGRCTGALELGLKLLAAAAYGGLLAVVGVWLLLPRTLLWAYAAAALLAAWRSGRRLRGWPSALAVPERTRWRLGPPAAMTAVCLAVTAVGLSGYSPPVPYVAALRSPLPKGVYCALNGGYSILINPHMKTLYRPELAGFRGQSYAVDLVKVDGWGRRAAGLLPSALEDYFIFGEPVYAPCAGVVARAGDGIPDRDPVRLELRPPAGNFVLLDCENAQVLLAHLMRGSVEVMTGERVEAGQPLGRVGNSGYSPEPHLHLHVQAHSAGGDFDTAPLPFRVDGQTLVRGSRLVSRGPAPPRDATSLP